jgi:D-glycero-D-manno-heptose 1,7-bisphosphate phosphatase
MRRAAFLDRDGVINVKAPEGEYVTRWEDMHFLPGVAPAIGMLNRAGFQVIVVSNQRAVAKGLITIAELESMHRRMSAALAKEGAAIDGIYYCPHEMTTPPCACRKPAPGMLLDAAREHQIDLAASWMIGDSEIDVEAGRSAGCKTVRLMPAGGNSVSKADLTVPALFDAIYEIARSQESLDPLNGASR